MNLNIPLESGSLTKTADTGATSMSAANAAHLKARVTLARLPEQVMRLQPQSSSTIDAFHVKVPSSFTFDDKAQHQLARTSNSAHPKSVLVEHISSTQRLVITPEQANKITDTVTKALPANASIPTGTIKATVVHAPSSQISLKLALPGNPVVNISLNQSVNLTQGNQVQLTISPGKGNEFKLRLNSVPPAHSLNTEIKLPPNHILAQQFTKLQLSTGITVSPQLLQNVINRVGLPSLQNGGIAPANLILRNNQLTITTTLSQPIAQVGLPHPVMKDLPTLPGHPNIKPLPQLLPFEPLFSKSTATEGAAVLPVNSPTIDSTQKQQIHNAIMQLSRHLLNETGSTRVALNQLISSLTTPSQTTSDNTVGVMRSLSQQLTQGFAAEASDTVKIASSSTSPEPATKVQTVQALQALFTSPALPVNSQALVSPVSQSGFVSALVAVLQMTLAGRAIRRQPHLGTLADDAGSFLAKSMSQLGATGSASKVSQEFSRLDGQRQMLENIKTLLANHRQQKLISADHRLQGQESFYLVLPVNSHSQAPPEVLFKREERNTDQKDSAVTTDKVWNFTMKLDIDELGKLLIKSKISPTTLQLNLYASTDSLLQKVTETMPMLLKRLRALGLSIEHSGCQRGKIPETLSDNPYQLFETRA